MIVNKLHYLWKKLMQYLHDNLKMHIVLGENYNTHIMTLIHTICGSPKCNTYMTF
jgi:hypothetical protein